MKKRINKAASSGASQAPKSSASEVSRHLVVYLFLSSSLSLSLSLSLVACCLASSSSSLLYSTTQHSCFMYKTTSIRVLGLKQYVNNINTTSTTRTRTKTIRRTMATKAYKYEFGK